jgi:hypothetical protein
MLVIRKDQMKALRASLQKRLVERLLVHVRTAFAGQTEAHKDSELRDLIRRAIEEAYTYGITVEGDVARYVEYTICYGAPFGRTPETEWAVEVLRREDLDGRAKMDAIDDLEEYRQAQGDDEDEEDDVPEGIPSAADTPRAGESTDGEVR